MGNDFWPIPELWPGSTVFIIGGGVSLLKQDLSLIHNHRVLGVNQAYKLGSWVDVCWFGDKGWYEDNIPTINDYGGLIATCSACRPELKRVRVKYVGRGKQSGLETKRRTHIGWNGNSGASAVNFAYWLGATTIVLLGFDMQNPEDSKDKQSHWHNDYKVRWDKKAGRLSNPYPRFQKYWPQIAKDAEEVGLKIINATVGGALEVFERKSLEAICQDLSAHML
jgi:hypothetical protein